MSDAPPPLLRRLLLVVGAGGLFASGFAAGRATSPTSAPPPAPAPSASSGYVRQKPGSYPSPPLTHNACYAAGSKTASLPCLGLFDPQLPMLLGQCNHPATEISDGPVLAQYAGSPAVICCYKAVMPTCSGRPLRVADRARVAPLMRGGIWHQDVTSPRASSALYEAPCRAYS